MRRLVVDHPVPTRAREFEIEGVVAKRQDLLRIDEAVVDRAGNEIGNHGLRGSGDAFVVARMHGSESQASRARFDEPRMPADLSGHRFIGDDRQFVIDASEIRRLVTQ